MRVKQFLPFMLAASAASPMMGGTAYMELTNVVCLLKFNDQQELARANDAQALDALLNSESEDDTSVWRYFSDTSYGSLSWKSHIVDLEYNDSHPRGYYCPQTATNPDGYTSIIQAYMREQSLIKDICRCIEPSIPAETMLDGNKDWKVDNLTIVVAGNSDSNSSSLLWPHNNTMVWSTAELHSCDINNYLMVFDGLNGSHPLNPGVMCHEMMHALGAYDLYSGGTLNPVGKWDLMSDNQTTPQGMTAYMRSYYGRKWGNWIPEIRTLDTEGTYTLKPIYSETPDDVAYIIKPDPTRQEYFMVEYRRKTGWDSTVPSSGLICYRINPDVSSNLSASKFELYIFRPEGSLTSKGNLDKANFNSQVRRTQFGVDDSYFPYYSDGERADFALTEIGKAEEDGIQFTLSFPSAGLNDIAADGPILEFDAAALTVYAHAGSPIEIYNISGELVGCGIGEISIADQPKGIYIARATPSNRHPQTIKIHKIK